MFTKCATKESIFLILQLADKFAVGIVNLRVADGGKVDAGGGFGAVSQCFADDADGEMFALGYAGP